MTTETKFKETEIGMIPEDWDIVTASVFCLKVTDGTHDSPKKKNEGKYLITSRHIKGSSIDFDNAYLISNDDYNAINKRSLVDRYDVLFSMIGTIGESLLVMNKPNYAIKNIGLFKFRGDLTKAKWFYYYLRSPYAKEYIFSRSSGSTQQYMTLRSLRDFPIVVTSSDEMQKIAKILSDLDSKIELLQQQNKTLEKIGQVLFKHWFVDFEFPNKEGKSYKSSGGKMVDSELGEIPEGWEIGKLKDILDKKNESTKPGKHLKNRKYVPIDNLPMKSLAFNTYLNYSEANSSLILFEKNDILLGAMRVYFHRVNISPFAGITRTTTFVLRVKKDIFLEYSLFLMYLDSTVQYANSQSKGSTMPYAVWKNSLELMPILIPYDHILQKFSKIVNPIVSKIRDSLFELENLQKIRDLLLPKLMTGKIRVPLEVRE